MTQGIPGAALRRDLTYIKPTKRRLTEYEAVTLHQQWETGGFDKGGHFIVPADGRAPWRAESTALVHPNWFAFRDPAQLWQRPYVRLQGEQERAIERMTEDAVQSGAFHDIDRAWLDGYVAGHYRVWSFFENGLFRAFAPAQREALSDCLGNVLCFQAFDQMRHAQAIVSLQVAIEDQIEGFSDAGAKQRWIEEAAYQPLRKLCEELIATSDWCEVAVATNLVVLPVVAEVAISGFIRKHAPLHGDTLTPFIAMTAERDRRRNLAWTQELVRMVTAKDVASAVANRTTVQNWIAKWQPRALAALEGLRPIAAAMPAGAADVTALTRAALARHGQMLAEVGLAPS
jgi:methane monooxygenase component A beta chain/propane monooxygenase small subunit